MIAKNTKIYLDMDGVLADFFTAWATMAGVKSGNWKDIPQDKINPTLDQMVGTDFFNTLPKFPTTNTLVDMVIKYTGEYHINSSPLRNDHENSGKWKKVWIKRELNPQPKSIILTSAKEKYAVNSDGSPNILIDDRGANIQAWTQAGGIGIKYQANENTISEVRARLDKIFNVAPLQDPEPTQSYSINESKKIKERDTSILKVVDKKLPNLKEPKKPTKFQRRKELSQMPREGKDKSEEPDVELNVHGDADKGYVLSKIVVPKELRNTGIGSKVMKDLTDKADSEGAIIALTPDNTYGGSKTRLTQFYRRFGFVPNKGRNKDFRYRETMIRYPVTEDISQQDLSNLEVFADRVFGKVGIDVEFTKHFLDRVNDERNQKDITVSELTRLFKQEAKRWGKPIAQMGPEQEAVMKDLQTDINLPFKLEYDKDNNELDLVAKTVMRKKDFKTGNRIFTIEEIQYTKPDFDTEWEEAIRYPEFKEMGKEKWIAHAKKGKIINIDNALSNLIGNTDAGEQFRQSWNELEPAKKKRFVKALDKEKVELPIIARFQDGNYELIGGNTRLTGLMLNKGSAKAWLFNV